MYGKSGRQSPVNKKRNCLSGPMNVELKKRLVVEVSIGLEQNIIDTATNERREICVPVFECDSFAIYKNGRT